MIQSDWNLVPNALKSIKNEHRSAQKLKKSQGRLPNDRLEWYPSRALHPSVPSELEWFPPSDHFEIPGDCPESELSSRRFCMWRFLVLLSLFHNVFGVRCGTNCIDSWHLPSTLLFILTQVPTHKKYRILYYHRRSNSGWLPIRCTYFI